MKKIKLYLITCWLMMLSLAMHATIYKIERKCYINKAFFSDLRTNTVNLGIKGNASGGIVKIRMWNARAYNIRGAYNSLLYAATSNFNSPNDFVATSYTLSYPASICSLYFIGNICDRIGWDQYYNEKSTDFKNRLLNVFHEQSIVVMYDFMHEPLYIDVIIELELPDNVTLSDIKEISVPGVEKLTNIDFTLKNDFDPKHYCADSNNANGEYCTKIKNIRKIDPVKNADVVVQAHRGLWGEEYAENSLGAIQSAKTKGLFLLEYDIMPYGVSNYTDATAADFAVPTGLVCFHDMKLTRLTDYNKQSGDEKYVFNSSKAELNALKLLKPRSTTVSNQGILFYEDLIRYAATNKLLICVDMKNLGGNDKNSIPRVLPLFADKANQLKSQMLNVKKCIELASTVIVNGQNGIKNIAIKTYSTYDELKSQLVDTYHLDPELFNQVLWAPRVSENSRNWGYDTAVDLDANGKRDYDPNKIIAYLNQWFLHNESVLYYETNFKNDSDNETATLIKDNYNYFNIELNNSMDCAVTEYIYQISGRRSGIFSEEPIGSKGVPGRWDEWSLKSSEYDRRADHIWLINHPYMQYSVITTDRPDIWDQFNK